jgi:transposase
MYLSKEEKERRIIDLYYNQGKTSREIVEELRVSPNYVSAVLKKHEEEENAAAVSKTKHKEEEDKISKQVAAYEQLSEGKNLIQVAIDLKLSEEEVTQFYIGFMNLKRLNGFGIAYEKHIHHIPYILKLCSKAGREGVSTGQLVKLCELVDENNPVGLSQLGKQRQWHLSELREMETEKREMETEKREIETQLHRMKAEKEKYVNELFLLKSEKFTLEDQLEDYRKSRERERLELEKLKKEKESIEESLRLGDIAE